ncbi:putative ribonuclease H-like domain-containing protein [Tanacetum coccineum]|uniref:Ribonuclease H-like domain-containing protein n=1 Tax=Tanacetum coccineum TaxID=301880 RepID=A0ABQ5DR29_9ASTR
MSGEESAPQMAPVESPHVVSSVKLPILKKGEYTLWSMRMEQYLTNTDYALWQVIMNGDEPVQTIKDENGVETVVLQSRSKFHGIKDAKTLWVAIKSRFNGLDKAYDRFQKLISLLEVHGSAVSNEDANQKFLRALPSSWNNVALIMRNKTGIDDLDINDLYNNLKVFEADIKSSSGSSSNSQNVAFLSTKDTNNINEVNTANGVSTTSGHNSQGQASSSTYTDDLIRGHFARECRATRNQGNRDRDVGYKSRDNIRRIVPVETFEALFDEERQTLSKDNLEIIAYKLGLESVEAQLVVHQKNEAVYKEKIAVLEFEVKYKGNVVTRLTNQLEQTLKEKEDLKAKLEQFETSSKNLNKLINSQISSKDKTGLGYRDQLNENDSSGSELFNSVFDSHLSDGDDNQTNDRFKKDNGYHAIPPPLTGNYKAPLANLSFLGLDDSVYRPTTNKTSASVSQVETSITPPSNTSVEMPRVEFVRPSGVIIEDWVSDDDEDIFQSNDVQTTIKPCFKKIKFTKARNEPVKADKQVVKPSMVTQSPKEKVNTVRVNGINTAGQTAVRTVKGDGVTAVKASAGCGNLQQALKYKRIFDSGCSRHMTGNKALLTDYQDIDGGFVAFGGSTRGGKITVTDDFSRFSWVFFLATKSETSRILKKFITEVENQLNHKVKVIMSDNGTEFKNREMDEFCGQEGIKREYSVAITPQQNRVAERKNRTLIKAARTMLADSLLPIVFWAESVNTTCYVLNRVLVTKPYNKTPYELIIGKAPSISFMRPFGCPVTILNTLDPLGKFDGKAEEGFLVGYSVNSKAFRVFNTETRKVEENLHVNFLKNKPNVAGQGPNWLFDTDSLTNSMNYQPVTAGNQTNKNAGPQETNGNTGLKKNVDARQTEEENVSTQQYIVFPLWSSISSNYKSSDDKAEDDIIDDDACKKTIQEPTSRYDQALKNVLDKMMDQEKEATEQSNAVRKEFEAQCDSQLLQEKITRASSTNSFNTVSTPVKTASASRTFSPIGPSFVPFGGSFPIDVANLSHDPLMPELEDTSKI